MKLFIECCDPTTCEMYAQARTKYDDDSGFDLHCPEDVIINTGGVTEINLGVKCWSPDGIGYTLVPRSSIHKYNIIQANSIGIIDAGYTGNIKANVLHFNNKRDGGLIASNIALFMTIVINHMMYSGVFPIAIIGTFIWCFFGSLCIYEKYNTNTIKAGTRLFQLVAFDGKPIDVEFVDKLPEEALTARGDNGFGSTDVNENDDEEEEEEESDTSTKAQKGDTTSSESEHKWDDENKKDV